MQKVLISKKKESVHQLDSNPQPPKCKPAALPIELYGCSFRWIVAQFSLSSTYCRIQADHRINSW